MASNFNSESHTGQHQPANKMWRKRLENWGRNYKSLQVFLRPKSGGQKEGNLSVNAIKDNINIFRNFRRRRYFCTPGLNYVTVSRQQILSVEVSLFLSHLTEYRHQ